MAKKILTQASYDVDNVQGLPVQVKNQASLVQQTFDKSSLDQKNYNNTVLLSELQSETLNDSGAHAIGLNVAEITAKNVADGMKENRNAISGIVLGEIPDNTLTELKMANEMKKQSGGVYPYNDGDTNRTNLDILRKAKLDTGVADAYIVNTEGTFSRVDGNILPFIPSNTNTGASTINEDGNGVANIKKYVDGAWIDLEEGDLNKFQQVLLAWNATESAFQLAPKGGSVKSIQEIEFLLNGSNTVSVPIENVKYSNSYVIIETYPTNSTLLSTHAMKAELELDGNSVTLSVFSNTTSFTGVLKVIEEKNIKSKQVITGSKSSGVSNITIDEVDNNKTFSILTASIGLGSSDMSSLSMYSTVTTSTNIKIDTKSSNVNYSCQIIERS